MSRQEQNHEMPFQYMYSQLLGQYQLLEANMHKQTRENLELYSELQRLMQERISLLQQEVPTQATLPEPYPVQSQMLQSSNKKSSYSDQNKSHSKRHRIIKQNRIYNCTYPDCTRNYRSSVSMNLHIKLKHNGGTKREREAVAKKLIDCEEKGQPQPEMTLNLPPNFLDEYRRTYEYSKRYNM